MQTSLEQRLEILPATAGVYLMKDGAGNVLYVGKAGSLRHRVSSYFGSPRNLSVKTQRMVAQIEDFEFFLTDSEQEAILLECNLIKKYRPRYNVRLKDDKSYPYLKVSLGESWPRVYTTRRLENDGSRYYGPFSSAGSVRQTLKLLRRLFPFRSCNKSIEGNDSRPCLDYHLHRCLGPCVGAVGEGEYRQMIGQVTLFMEGRQETIVGQLRRKMDLAARNMDFEKAAVLRDQICAVEKVIERQNITAAEGEIDVIAFARARAQAYMQVFFIRNGKLLGKEYFILEGTQDEEPSRIITEFITQFYNCSPSIPPLILVQHPVESKEMVEEWLRHKRGARVEIRLPKRGAKAALMNMVADNARQGLEQLMVKLVAEPEVAVLALEQLERGLSLPRIPRRVECYDISNVQGAWAVGSMVVFEQAQPKKSQYRRFRIRTVTGADDYAMLQEVLRRRFSRGSDKNWANIPDLVLIDGGKGQLNAVLQVMQCLGVSSVPVASIAKEKEEIFLPHSKEPVIIPSNSSAMYLVQRIRDEAHRFALDYYRRLHQKGSFSSAFDAVPGIGAKRQRALLRKFGSVRAIKEASAEEISTVEGITPSLAKRVKEYL